MFGVETEVYGREMEYPTFNALPLFIYELNAKVTQMLEVTHINKLGATLHVPFFFPFIPIWREKSSFSCL